MGFDLVIRGAKVIDGTGLPGYVADVGIRGERIGRIGRIREEGARELDGRGLVLAPGFIDVHTHYDVQLDWDPTASPASWHGVTTILAGNCGFTLAPARPEDVDWLAGMLSRVEGMSRAALEEGLRDFPADSARFVIDAEGYVAVVVNGQIMMDHGKYTGAKSGRVIWGA